MHAEGLRVLHVDTERGWRGGERQMLWLAERLASAGHTSIIAARPGEALAIRAGERGISVIGSSPLFEFDPFAAFALQRTIRRERVDVVHAHTGHAVALAAMARIGTRAKMVLTRRVDFRPRINAGTRWKYGRADAIIAVSEAAARGMVESGIDRSRIEVVHDGVDLTHRIRPASAETLASIGVPNGAPLVVQVAALVGHKDPVTFVRAMAAARRWIPDVHAVMVGEGRMRPVMEAAIAELGLGEVVHLAGYRTDADSFIAAADVVTLSSSEEGMGSVLIDAMSLGRPVAAMAGGGIPEVVLDGVTGLLVPVGDHEALGAAIARILGDSELASRFAAAGRVRAENFSIEKTVEGTLRVYRRCLNRDSGFGTQDSGLRTRSEPP